ncbi:MAG: hypothetical protein J5730_03535 [Bacteroidales bacterium]|nr:hypothetical protein [Bacteroidales bacterium]
MALIKRWKRRKSVVEIEFMIGDKVWFIPKGEKEAISGEVIRIQADVKRFNKKTIGDVKYTIVDDVYGECFDVSYDNVYSKKYEAEGFYKFECRVYFTANAYQRETVFAKNPKDAEEMIKQRCPNVYNVEYDSYE